MGCGQQGGGAASSPDLSSGGETSTTSQQSGATSSAEESHSSGATSQQSSSSQEGSVVVEKDAEYEAWVDTWSQSGHLYVHYLRPDAGTDEYDGRCIWAWQHYPSDLEGALWGFSADPVVSSKLTLKPMTTHWMRNSELGQEGATTHIDKYGAIMDIDLYADNLIGGKTGKPVTYEGMQNLGFLIVDQSSMDGKTNWTSDGGKETYVKNFDEHFREDGSMHLYVVTGSLSDYKFEAQTQRIRVNPVTKDTSAQYVSKNDSIADKLYDGKTSLTSDEFKSLGVGYQIFVASFKDSNGDGMGDIRGIIDSLDYLEDLGTQVLWLTPIQQSDSYHGYDISDYYAVDPKFGTEDDYRELLYKAHERGMKVVMDLVLNHTSKNNVWFEKSQWAINSQGGETDDTGIEWRNVYSWKYETDKIQKYNAKTGSYETITVLEDSLSENPSWYRDGESHYYYYGKFGSGMPEINYEYQPTRNLVKDMAKYWLSFGLDGFRLDAVKHIYMKDEVSSTGSDIIIKDVGTKRAFDDERGDYVEKDFDYSSDVNKNITWWKEFANDLKGVFPNCFLVGENFDGWGTRTAPYYQALDSQFDFANYYHIVQYLYANPEHYGLKAQGNGGASGYSYNEPLETFDVFSSMSNSLPLGDTGVSVPGGHRADFIDGAFTSNHDVPRAINQVNGTWASTTDTTPSAKITGSAQEIGRAKVHAAVTMLLPGVSWIYYGDELGMSGNTDTHISTYGNENSMDIWYRQPMKWGDDATAEGTTSYKAGQYSFEWDSYNKNLAGVTSQTGVNTSMLEWYRALADIKSQYPKNAKVKMEGAKDILKFTITGDSGPSWKLFINCGFLDSEEYGVDAGGYTQYNSPALANGATSSTFASTSYSVLAYKK